MLSSSKKNTQKRDLGESMNQSLNFARKTLVKQKKIRNSETKQGDQKVLKEKLKALQLLEKESISSQQKIMSDSGLTLANNNFGGNLSKLSLTDLLENVDLKRVEKMASLGQMGVDLEEMRVGMECKYEEMLDTLKQKLDQLKNHFSQIIDTLKLEFNQQMLNEKQQNLENLKKLEGFLEATINNTDEGELESKKILGSEGGNQTKLIAFQELFTFVKEFKNEAYSLILSRLADLNIPSMKK